MTVDSEGMLIQSMASGLSWCTGRLSLNHRSELGAAEAAAILRDPVPERCEASTVTITSPLPTVS